MYLTVFGTPAPQGSKRHIGNGRMVESSKKVAPWRQDVKHTALNAINNGQNPITGPVTITVTFYLPRPKGHYGTGRNRATLKPSAPVVPAVKPDLDKLLRSTLDALTTAGAYTDDQTVVTITATKVYADHRPPGADITLTPVVAPHGVGLAGGDLMVGAGR